MGRERRLEYVPMATGINKVLMKIGETISWVYALLIATILLQVVLRKGFSSGFIVLEELQWHLYAIGVMIGISYSQALDSHVRVDLFYDRFSPRTQHLIDLLGMIFFVFPVLWVVFYHSIEFVAESYRAMESSSAPAGLPYRFLIKSIIPISMLMMAAACLNRLYADIYLFIKGGAPHGS